LYAVALAILTVGLVALGVHVCPRRVRARLPPDDAHDGRHARREHRSERKREIPRIDTRRPRSTHRRPAV